MSTETEERRNPVDVMLEDVPYPDLQDQPSETPLTREAVVHLRAAAKEVSGVFRFVQSAISTVERALSQPMGDGKTFSEEERMDLADLLQLAREKAETGMMEPVFERGRGERPHSDAPHLSIGEEEIHELVVDLYRIDTAACADTDDEEERQRLLGAIGMKAEAMADEVCEAAGIPVHDGTIEEFIDAAAGFEEKAKKHGRDAVGIEEEV